MGFVARFFVLVTIVTFGEMYLLLEVAARAGVLVTILGCVLTGVIGGTLVRIQGWHTIAAIQKAMSRAEIPAVDMVSGAILIAVGALLVTPGFLTDTAGFLMLIPALRSLVARRLIRWFKRKAEGSRTRRGSPDSVVIDVEPEPINDEDPAQLR